jgi:hypothetical protein
MTKPTRREFLIAGAAATLAGQSTANAAPVRQTNGPANPKIRRANRFAQLGPAQEGVRVSPSEPGV